MPAPTFLCIGAQKCGTTWLARAVKQHPQVSPGKKKELHFFNHRDAYEQGLDWYESQFRSRPQTRATGEFTPNYWWTKGTETSFHYLGAAPTGSPMPIPISSSSSACATPSTGR